MSRRREVRGRIATLAEIDEILTAMKNLALVEVRRIAEFIEAQRAAVAVIEDAAADFLADFAPPASYAQSGGDVVCLLGSERGFCGDFNETIAQAAKQRNASPPAASAVLLVGSRMADAYGDPQARAISGAGVADEVPAVLQLLVESLTGLLGDPSEAGVPTGLVVIHHGDAGVSAQRLLPLPDPPRKTPSHAYPLLLNLPPAQFFEGLTEQYVYAGLQAALYESLLEESRRRRDHMELAIDRLGDQLRDLHVRQNRLRQEEITEEIEIILLSAGLADLRD